jgi:hypothetical protein
LPIAPIRRARPQPMGWRRARQEAVPLSWAQPHS